MCSMSNMREGKNIGGTTDDSWRDMDTVVGYGPLEFPLRVKREYKHFFQCFFILFLLLFYFYFENPSFTIARVIETP